VIGVLQQIAVNEFKKHLKQAEEAGKINDTNRQAQELEKAIGKFLEMEKTTQRQLQVYIYRPYRDLGRLKFIANSFEEARTYLDKAQRLARTIDDADNFDNICNIKRMLAHCFIVLGLNTKSKTDIEVAKEIISNLKKILHKISLESLVDEIEKEEQIIKGIESNEVYTTIECDLPFPIIAKENEKITFVYKEYECFIEISMKKSPLCPWIVDDHGYLELIEDKYGIANHSHVTLTMQGYINPNETVVMNDSSIFLPLYFGIEALNKFIEVYRVSTKHYWVSRLSDKMITNFSCKIMVGQIELRNVPFSGHGTYRMSSDPPQLREEQFSRLVKYLEKDQLPLWESLLMDAKEYLVIKRYREAIFAINGAFENFLKIKVKERLSRVLDPEVVKSYMNGHPTYDEFFLKDYVNEMQFNEAFKKGIIKYIPPSTFHMIKKCHKFVPFKVSYNKISSMIARIRGNRNEIFHGEDIIDNLEYIVKQSINSFEELVTLFDD